MKKLDWSKTSYSHSKSQIIIANKYIYKKGEANIINREYECLDRLKDTGYVPPVKRENNILIINKINATPITNKKKWMSHYLPILNILKKHNIRHGDLTSANIIPHFNKPHIIDFGESTTIGDVNIKRPEPDSFWLYRGMIYHIDFNEYPVFYNQRVPEMWQIIKPTLPSDVKSLADLGSGRCDLSIRTMIDTGCFGYLVEKDRQLRLDMIYKIDNLDFKFNYQFSNYNIEDIIKTDNKFHVMYACSIIPYFDIDTQKRIINYMSMNSKVSYIEFQYKNDGPGTFKNNYEAKVFLLNNGFKCADNIGKTYVVDRKKYRYIWRCYA